ncbi:hypothetical protein PR048_016329 [Dryococelus australis]|uniref:Uncharacterized protein n=1 Tax=Dryococelus australis TaxID=614101 RepID=A0ABQ9HJF0_9NEOP|nr:hypothetical protein PR048_016329 [Dryococelus australis]
MPLVHGLYYRFPPPLYSGAAPYSLRFARIGSQDLVLKVEPFGGCGVVRQPAATTPVCDPLTVGMGSQHDGVARDIELLVGDVFADPETARREYDARQRLSRRRCEIWNYFPSIVTNFTGRMSRSAPIEIYAGRDSDYFLSLPNIAPKHQRISPAGGTIFGRLTPSRIYITLGKHSTGSVSGPKLRITVLKMRLGMPLVASCETFSLQQHYEQNTRSSDRFFCHYLPHQTCYELSVHLQLLEFEDFAQYQQHTVCLGSTSLLPIESPSRGNSLSSGNSPQSGQSMKWGKSLPSEAIHAERAFTSNGESLPNGEFLLRKEPSIAIIRVDGLVHCSYQFNRSCYRQEVVLGRVYLGWSQSWVESVLGGVSLGWSHSWVNIGLSLSWVVSLRSSHSWVSIELSLSCVENPEDANFQDEEVSVQTVCHYAEFVLEWPANISQQGERKLSFPYPLWNLFELLGNLAKCKASKLNAEGVAVPLDTEGIAVTLEARGIAVASEARGITVAMDVEGIAVALKATSIAVALSIEGIAVAVNAECVAVVSEAGRVAVPLDVEDVAVGLVTAYVNIPALDVVGLVSADINILALYVEGNCS